jgi:hypothetical protein
MPGKSPLSGPTAAHTVYKYVGDGRFIMSVPARDLTAADLLEFLDREGITHQDVEASGLYLPVERFEIIPFCGAPTATGGRCKRQVSAWGERCYQHQEVNYES